MKIAIAGDFHSNSFALEVFISELPKYDIDLLIITGDIFGYYPWAAETYRLIKSLSIQTVVIKGNHDQFILDKMNDLNLTMETSYWPAIEQNLIQLAEEEPECLSWLGTLNSHQIIFTDDFTFDIYHGTPLDSLNGRFYPDNTEHRLWFPLENEFVVLGHTHYPLIKRTERGGCIINPGSIGQPRDGSVDPSWIFVDEKKNEIVIQRFKYDVDLATTELERMGWDERAIKALKKDYKGTLEL